MKLLFDQNLSPRLVTMLSDIFPGSGHNQSLGLDRSTDAIVWAFARNNDFLIVTKDVDFSDRSACRVPAEDHLGSHGQLHHTRHRGLECSFREAS